MEVIPTTRTASRDFYQAYINSPEWRKRRNRALQDAGWRCSRCPSKRDLQVHHVSYERLGREWDRDLEVLCDMCHRGEHLENPDQTSLGLYLKLASEAVSKNPWASIADLSEVIKLRCVELRIPLLPERIKSAISVVCGHRLAVQPPQTFKEVGEIRGRPVTHEEARDFLCRLGMVGGLKTMPTGQIGSAGKQRTIDIYGPVDPDDWRGR